MNQPSLAATRAAEAIKKRFDVIGESYSSGMGESVRDATTQQLATIIERETGIAEAITLAHGILALRTPGNIWSVNPNDAKKLEDAARAFLQRVNQS